MQPHPERLYAEGRGGVPGRAQIVYTLTPRNDLVIQHIPRGAWRMCYAERCVPLMRVVEVIMQEGQPEGSH